MKKIAFTGGGSAGHVIPNVALIQEILKTGEADVCYFGSDGIEKKIIASLKIPYHTIHPPKLQRQGGMSALKNNFRIPFALLSAQKQAMEGLQQFQPNLIFSKGGYVALPVVNAAHRMHIPCISHESDYSIGLANRFIAKKCEILCTSFPETASNLRNQKFTGQPIRAELFSRHRAAARRELCEHTSRQVLLIFGGGSGSEAINQAVRTFAPTLARKYYLLHVCGHGNTLASRIQNYKQVEFIQDMGAAYAAADLIICRSGAGAVFEALALKKRTLFIPLEKASRGDQKENAAYFQRLGLCHVLPQERLHELPIAIEQTLRDKQLTEALERCPIRSGTDNVLHEIRTILMR